MSRDDDSAVLTRAFLAYRASLSRYLATFFVSREDIEDTVQDAYLKTLAAQKDVEIVSPRGYLFRVARNIALNKKARQRRLFEENIEDFCGLIVMDDSASPYEQVYSRAKMQAFCDAIEALPPQCRRVFWMQRIEGLSYKEIAKKLGISTRTVEKHLEKALARCAEHLMTRGFSDDETGNVESIEKHRQRLR